MFVYQSQNFSRKRQKRVFVIVCCIGIEIDHVQLLLFQGSQPHLCKRGFTFAPGRIYDNNEAFRYISQQTSQRLPELPSSIQRILKWIIVTNICFWRTYFHSVLLNYPFSATVASPPPATHSAELKSRFSPRIST